MIVTRSHVTARNGRNGRYSVELAARNGTRPSPVLAGLSARYADVTEARNGRNSFARSRSITLGLGWEGDPLKGSPLSLSPDSTEASHGR